MKKTILFSMALFWFAFAYSQNYNSAKNYQKGSKALEKKQYQQAISLLTLSINENPTANAYFNRAVAYNYIGDSCKFCSDLKRASRMGDTEALKLYKENCSFNRLNFNIPDSIKIKYPDVNHFEISNDKCTHDSTIKVIFVKGSETWTTDINKIDGEVFTIVENMPQYEGGDDARNRFLAENIIYPTTATSQRIQGTVYVSFIIDQQGNVTNVKVLKGIGGGCDEEAIRVVSLMPVWISGTQDGKKVRVLFNMPIYFKLQR